MGSETQSSEIVERFIAGGAADTNVSQELLSWVKKKLQEGRADEVEQVFPRLIIPGLDYTVASALSRLLKQLRKIRPSSGKPTKIALLGSMTVQHIGQFLELQLEAARVQVEFYESNYGTIHQEFFDSDSGLHRFRPDFVVILTTWHDLGQRPQLSDGRDSVKQRVEKEVANWEVLWSIAREKLGCQIIQTNFVPPPWRTMGNLETRNAAGFGRYIGLVNSALADRAPSEVTIYDADSLAAEAGRKAWGDERFYYQAKLPCAPEYLVDYAHGLAALVLAQIGKAKKCLVLDLDNTLWGGVIGDDGIDGIRIGQGEAEGEAFAAFQTYAKSLAERGVILAVCSKNTDAIAREAFEKHSGMVLKLADISCFIANWDDKASNLARIAEELNIGLNSLVFFDDNPAERSVVRQLQPDVAVPEVPADPAYYIAALERYRYFEATSISSEDLKRTEFYRADSDRKTLASSSGNLDSFLQSLEMTARVEPVTSNSIERSVQLISRSNQFNLTTRRYTNAEVVAIKDRPDWLTRTISLTDRFGDNGLISVVLARIDGESLVIDTWLMSCRVLKRGVERLVLNNLADAALSRGLKKLVGEYVPTKKNDLVRDHYETLGFRLASADPSGGSLWELPLDQDAWSPQTHFIRELT